MVRRRAGKAAREVEIHAGIEEGIEIYWAQKFSKD
jgi:hypothetical protein